MIASHSIQKAFKTNAIESSNAGAKLYLGHKAWNLYEAVYLVVKMADDVKDHMIIHGPMPWSSGSWIMALYNEEFGKMEGNSNFKIAISFHPLFYEEFKSGRK